MFPAWGPQGRAYGGTQRDHYERANTEPTRARLVTNQDGDPSHRASVAPGRPTSSAAWALRVAGLSALLNALGFGAFDIPGIWHLAHDNRVRYALGNPTYGYGPFDAQGIPTTVPLLLAFLGSCVGLAPGGALPLAPRPIGVVATLAGIVMCAPFWWGFDLPLSWINAAT